MMNRALTATVLVGGLLGLANVADAAPPPPAANQLQPAPSNQTRIALPPAHTIKAVALASDGFFVTVASTAKTIASIELHVGAQKVPVQTRAEGDAIIHVTDPASLNVCNLGTIGFSLEGAKADTSVHHVVAKSPMFNAASSGVTGGGAAIGDATGKVTFTAGGALHWYGCGEKFEIGAEIKNDTDFTPQQLKIQLIDVDGSTIGEAPVSIPPHTKANIKLATSGNVVGRTGSLHARLVDPSGELAGKLINGRVLGFTITRQGPAPTLKLVD